MRLITNMRRRLGNWITPEVRYELPLMKDPDGKFLEAFRQLSANDEIFTVHFPHKDDDAA
jgi:hypothetical protein